MGTPSENPDGYRGASAIEQAGQLKGKLMLIHGLLDENVHFRNTARFVQALESAGKSYDLLIYPSGRHGLRSETDRRHMHERVVEFFEKNL
jgi:dipeptidyl-peptidase-4